MPLRIFHVPGRSGPGPSPKTNEFSIPICIGIVGHLATSRTYGQVDSAYLCIKIIEGENGSHVRMHVV